MIDDFKDEGYNFNHIAEMHIITIDNKMEMSYDFSIKHNTSSLNEWYYKRKSVNDRKNPFHFACRKWYMYTKIHNDVVV